MLSWAVWFKFLLNKFTANTCLFILTSFSKQSASWKVLEICELCALFTDSRKTYSVNKCMYTGSSSYSFDWGGGIIRWGEETEKTLMIFRQGTFILVTTLTVILQRALCCPMTFIFGQMRLKINFRSNDLSDKWDAPLKRCYFFQ